MYWQKRFDSQNPNEEIEHKIKTIFQDHKGKYGYRRITATLRNFGIVINQKKVRRLMKKLGLNGCPYRRTFHSDQGWAYQMNKYTKTLKENKIFQSMSRKGTCLDNSIMENFFGIMKQEMYYGKTYRSFTELELEIKEYIHYYNNERIKEKLNWNSPVNYRIKHELKIA